VTAMLSVCLYLTEVESLNGRKIICMPVFYRELEFKRLTVKYWHTDNFAAFKPPLSVKYWHRYNFAAV
jgi:hypothetical protein